MGTQTFHMLAITHHKPKKVGETSTPLHWIILQAIWHGFKAIQFNKTQARSCHEIRAYARVRYIHGN